MTSVTCVMRKCNNPTQNNCLTVRINFASRFQLVLQVTLMNQCEMHSSIAPILKVIFDHSLNTGVVPNDWK